MGAEKTKNIIKDVVIVGMCRTAIGKFQGSLSSVPAVELAKTVSAAAIKRAGAAPENIDEVVLGTVYKHGMKGNPARQVQLALGIPIAGAAVTVEQQCASSMRALEIACQQIQLGKTEAALVCGVESMSNVPYMLLNARKGFVIGPSRAEDAMQYDALTDAFSGESIMRTAENVAQKYNASRKEQDEYALLSQQRADAAIKAGVFKEEIIPVEIKTRKGTVVFDTDEHPRAVTLQELSALKPAFMKDGTVTAGNASGINDGASAAVIMSEDKAKSLGLKPLARILSTATAGCAPELMGIGPIYAIPKAIELAGLQKGDIDYYEINEAFAAQVVPCLKILEIPLGQVNANGSGIALGHPVGMTGLRLIISGYYELKRRGMKIGCASLCAGGGPAMAAVYEVIN
ncbi:MAG: thiolase family protein [Acidaminococcales bacterium]|jgi:acetyl-CoA C-acetyltransferase|nr:thiolase family protein [Acidaminococcales bacterium]